MLFAICDFSNEIRIQRLWYVAAILIPLCNQHLFAVVLTDGSVTNDLYPSGAKGILGYGLNLPDDSPPGASLLGKFLPCVNFQVYMFLS
jgi:hypothetical protein